MRRFHVIVEINDIPLQFDVSETVIDGDLAFKIRTVDHGEITMCYDLDEGRYCIKGTVDDFWKSIEEDLDTKIQFENF